MIQDREVTTAQCDGCGKVQYYEAPDDIQGYTGTTVRRHEQGGYSADWFACRERCIQRANVNALGRALQQEWDEFPKKPGADQT